MKPPVFDYHAVSSVDQAISRLSQLGPDARILAGGQSLVPMMKLRMARPAALIDINNVVALDYVHLEDGYLAIGAMRRLHTLNLNKHIYPWDLVGEALPHIGHEATRHRGTMCGSLGHADPSAELPVIASCLEAQIVTRSATAQRVIPANDFFLSFFQTSLEPDELIIEVRLPILPAGTGWAFKELSKHHAKFALTAVTLRRGKNSTVADARIAMGAVGERPIRATAAERSLEGMDGNMAAFQAAAASSVAELEPPSDVHGTSIYRKKAVQVLIERALNEAWERTQLFEGV